MHDYVQRVKGDSCDSRETLLKEPFDYIFFTGSTRVGKLVMHKAADQLFPSPWNFGGKTPALLMRTAT